MAASNSRLVCPNISGTTCCRNQAPAPNPARMVSQIVIPQIPSTNSSQSVMSSRTPRRSRSQIVILNKRLLHSQRSSKSWSGIGVVARSFKPFRPPSAILNGLSPVSQASKNFSEFWSFELKPPPSRPLRENPVPDFQI